jgi:hypothetical protein
MPERSDPKSDRMIKTHFKDLRENGMPFSKENSVAYGPLTSLDFRTCLHDLRFKSKSSPMIQMADLFLYPICMNGYNRLYKPYLKLVETGKLIDAHIEPNLISTQGIKYSCFDAHTTKTP